MNDWSSVFYYTLQGSALLLSALGLWFSTIMPGVDLWSKRFFQAFFGVLLLSCFSAFLEATFYLNHIFGLSYRLAMFLSTVFMSMPLVMLTAYLLHCSGESINNSGLFRIVLGLYILANILSVATLSNDLFYYVTPDMVFRRGALYTLLILPLCMITVLNLTGAIKRRAKLSRKVYISFLVAILPMTVALIIHLFVDVFPLIYISSALSAVSMYSLILSDQIERNLRYQQEIANQRASIMVLQMRPHFIYNTMTSIYCLCNQDPQKARQVVLDFTTYLRKNFTAIASAEPIPFSAELEHVRAYLAVEKAQYEDSLFVEYDTPHTMFRVPPLTLQPIVENAVKHGRDPYAGPFHISIRTRKTDSASEITVSDNGRGFDPADDSEPHIALRNIRLRLEMMCGGELTITPNDGGGTVVTVTIPDSKAA